MNLGADFCGLGILAEWFSSAAGMLYLVMHTPSMGVILTFPDWYCHRWPWFQLLTLVHCFHHTLLVHQLGGAPTQGCGRGYLVLCLVVTLHHTAVKLHAIILAQSLCNLEFSISSSQWLLRWRWEDCGLWWLWSAATQWETSCTWSQSIPLL